MGPQPCGHGYYDYDDNKELRDQVSMGPQPCGHGYDKLEGVERRRMLSFNGATTLRSWIQYIDVRFRTFSRHKLRIP